MKYYEVNDVYDGLFSEETTNGDMIKAMFPKYKFSICGDWVHIEFKGRQFSFCPTEFWNTPYKKESED